MTPITFTWDGEAFIPLQRFRAKCDQDLVVGQRYVLTAVEERSAATHGHQFAWLHEKWLDLPEVLKTRFPTSEHLRKHALIMCGFRDEKAFVTASKAEARRLAAFLRPIDKFSIVSINDTVVVLWTARSQSYKAMPKNEFQRSKSAVLQYVEDLISGDVNPEEETHHP